MSLFRLTLVLLYNTKGPHLSQSERQDPLIISSCKNSNSIRVSLQTPVIYPYKVVLHREHSWRIRYRQRALRSNNQ
jgi:hypothetical protein